MKQNTPYPKGYLENQKKGTPFPCRSPSPSSSNRDSLCFKDPFGLLNPQNQKAKHLNKSSSENSMFIMRNRVKIAPKLDFYTQELADIKEN